MVSGIHSQAQPALPQHITLDSCNRARQQVEEECKAGFDPWPMSAASQRRVPNSFDLTAR